MAKTTYTVALSKVIKELSLNTVSMPENPDRILISSTDVNRPGLELNGFLTKIGLLSSAMRRRPF